MREYVKVAPSVWQSKRFKNLSDDGKLFYFQCLTSPRVNAAGIYQNEVGYIMVDLKWPEARIRKAIAEVVKSTLIAYDEKEAIVIIDKWFDHNPPSNPKHSMKIFADTLSIPFTPLLAKVLQDFSRCLEVRGWFLPPQQQEKMDSLCHTLSISYMGKKSPTETESETETETERETERETKDKGNLGMLPAIAESPAPQKDQKLKGTRLPDDWKVEAELGKWAMAQGLTREQVLKEQDKFKNYWTSRADKGAIKLDWDKTFKNWVYKTLGK